MTDIIDLAQSREFVAELERDPDRVQLYHGELSTLIAECMEEVHELAKVGETERDVLFPVFFWHSGAAAWYA